MATKRRNKILKITGIVLGVLILLVIGGGLYLQSRADKIIEREFAKLTHNQYTLKADKINVSLFNRSVTFSNLNIVPNRNAAAHADTTAGMPKYLVDFSARELFVAGIRFSDKEGATSIGIRKLQLQAPKVKIEEMPASGDIPQEGRKVNPVRVDIQRIIISDGYAEHRKLSSNDTIRNVIEGFALETDKVLIDTDKGITQSALGDNARLTIAKITHMPADESTRLEVDSLTVGTAEQAIRIGSLSIIPTYTKEEFGHKAWRHADWQRASFSGISCHGVDFGRLFGNGELHIDSVHLAQGGYSSYKNRNIGRTEWIKPMHYQTIQRIPVKFAVRTGVIGSVDAQYEELKAGGDKAGIITFNKIGGRIDWLSNIPTTEHTYSEWRLHAQMMNTGTLTVTGYMPIDSLNDRFELMAVLGKTDARVLNDMIVPLNNLTVTAGTIDKMDFHIVGNTHQATVDMTFLYNGLKIALLKEKDGRIKEESFISRIVNNMVLLDSNPLHKETRRAHESTQRDPYRSPWNYLWRTIFAGAKETIGLGKL